MEINFYRLLSLLAIACFSIYLAINLLLYLFQRQLIYFPTPASSHNYDEIEFNINGEHIKVIALERDTQAAILYFGGNAESVASSAAELDLHVPEYSIFLVNYRGYGGSTGEPSEAALCDDALLIFDSLQARYKTVYVIGRSLGSGVASFLASQRPVEKLILITPFDSILKLAQQRFPILPVAILLKDSFDSARRAESIQSQTLIVAAQNDEIIPAKHTQELISHFSATHPVAITIPHASHNTISQYDLYYQNITEFLK